MPLTNHGHPSDNLRVKLPSALAVVFSQLGAKFHQAQVEFEGAFFNFGHSQSSFGLKGVGIDVAEPFFYALVVVQMRTHQTFP